MGQLDAHHAGVRAPRIGTPNRERVRRYEPNHVRVQHRGDRSKPPLLLVLLSLMVFGCFASCIEPQQARYAGNDTRLWLKLLCLKTLMTCS